MANTRQNVINGIIYWTNIIRSSVVNNAAHPEYGPPVVRLNHGALYRDIPCVVSNYSIQGVDRFGLDLKTLLPRQISYDLELFELRSGTFEEFVPADVIKRDNLAGWESVIATPNTMDPQPVGMGQGSETATEITLMEGGFNEPNFFEQVAQNASDWWSDFPNPFEYQETSFTVEGKGPGIHGRLLPERSQLKFYFTDGEGTHTVWLPFYENIQVRESKKARYATYKPFSRASDLYAYTGADSRVLKLSFNMTLPHLLELGKNINPEVYTIKSESTATEKAKFFNKGITPTMAKSQIMGGAEKLENEYSTLFGSPQSGISGLLDILD